MKSFFFAFVLISALGLSSCTEEALINDEPSKTLNTKSYEFSDNRNWRFGYIVPIIITVLCL